MKAEMHCHSVFSDGCLGYEEIFSYAKNTGLSAIALTDHDHFPTNEKIKLSCEEKGMRFIFGAEMSCKDYNTNRRVHLLCYLPKDVSPLKKIADETLKKRNEVGEYIIQRILKAFPIPREAIEKYSKNSACIYKAHIMRALLDYGFDKELYGKLYNFIFYENKERFSLPIAYPNVLDVLSAAKEAGSVTVLAHPSVYKSMDLAKSLAKKGLIDGVEIYHPKNKKEDIAVLEEMAKEFNLIKTGGTDFHGFHNSSPNPIGSFTTDEKNLKEIFSLSERK